MVKATRRAVYVGPMPHLVGKTALLQDKAPAPGFVLAQFDDVQACTPSFDVPVSLGFGWHAFDAMDFTLPVDKA